LRCRITSMSQGGLQPPGLNGSPFSLETHRYLFTFDNHGNFSLTIGEHQHFFQCVGIIDHTDVFNRSVFSGVGLTGCQRMGSRVFPKIVTFAVMAFSHVLTLVWQSVIGASPV